jgi:hypothetical protein
MGHDEGLELNPYRVSRRGVGVQPWPLQQAGQFVQCGRQEQVLEVVAMRLFAQADAVDRQARPAAAVAVNLLGLVQVEIRRRVAFADAAAAQESRQSRLRHDVQRQAGQIGGREPAAEVFGAALQAPRGDCHRRAGLLREVWFARFCALWEMDEVLAAANDAEPSNGRASIVASCDRHATGRSEAFSQWRRALSCMRLSRHLIAVQLSLEVNFDE